MPSELKNNWDLLIKDLISGLFCGFIENPLVYVNLIQDLLKLIEEFAEQQINSKTDFLAEALNLVSQRDSVYKTMLLLFQDYHSAIFALQPADLDNLKSQFKLKALAAIRFKYSSFERNCQAEDEKTLFDTAFREEDIKELIENSEFDRLIGLYHSLSLYMRLSDPPLRTNISHFPIRDFVYVLFKKQDFHCIDGFVKDNSVAIIAVPAIRRGTHVFNGMKPGVLILGKELTQRAELQAIAQRIKDEESRKSFENSKEAQNCEKNSEKTIYILEKPMELSEKTQENREKAQKLGDLGLGLMEKPLDSEKPSTKTETPANKIVTTSEEQNPNNFEKPTKQVEQLPSNYSPSFVKETPSSLTEKQSNANNSMKKSSEKDIITEEKPSDLIEIDAKTKDQSNESKENNKPFANTLETSIKLAKFQELSKKLSTKSKTFNQ